MSSCCDIYGCLSGVTAEETALLYDRIRKKLGAPVVQVELTDSQIEVCFCQAIEEYSSYINNWAMENRLVEMLGLPTEIDFTLKYVSNSLYFEKSFAQSFSEQLGIGQGDREVKKDLIYLTSGTQDYFIPANREVNEVLWFTPSFVNLFGLDPFANTNIAYSEFGASYAGYTLYHVMPVFDTLLTAQAAELRNRVRGAEYSYIIRPGSNGTKRLSLFPVPYGNSSGSTGGAGIGSSTTTPGTVWYWYYDSVGSSGNPLYSGNTQNPTFSGSVGNGLVSGPSDAQLNYLSYGQMNSVARTWVKKYAEALAKELLARNIRGKFNGTLPIPDAELTLNSDSLTSDARADKELLMTQLKEQLDKLNFKTMMENKAAIQDSLNKILSYGPLGIYVF